MNRTIYLWVLMAVLGPVNLPAQSFSFRQMLTDSSRNRYDHLGSVLACDEQTLVAGVPEKDRYAETDTALVEVGVVYVYRKQNGRWALHQQIVSPEGQEFARFGQAVALHNNRLAVSAPLFSVMKGGKVFKKQSGRVYLYRKDPQAEQWVPDGTLEAPVPQPESWFGFALAWNGEHLAVSAPLEDRQGDYTGAVYVFGKTGQHWECMQQLQSSKVCEGEKFGNALAAANGRLVVASPAFHVTTTHHQVKQAGKVEVFQWNGNRYEPCQTLYAQHPGEGAGFGTALATYRNRLLVTAATATTEEKGVRYPRSGNAYAYLLDDSGSFRLSREISCPDSEEGMLFGSAAALSGPFMALSAPVKSMEGNLPYTGAVYLYKETVPGSWTFYQRVILPVPVQSAGFGKALALWYNALSVGAYREGRNGQGDFIFDAGAIYLFH